MLLFPEVQNPTSLNEKRGFLSILHDALKYQLQSMKSSKTRKQAEIFNCSVYSTFSIFLGNKFDKWFKHEIPTNRLKDLDQASIRRFELKLGFDYLDPEGNVIFYQKLLEGLVDEPLESENMAKLKDIRNLAPGDFKTVRDRFIFASDGGLNHHTLVAALKNEALIKNVFLKTASIGFWRFLLLRKGS